MLAWLALNSLGQNSMRMLAGMQCTALAAMLLFLIIRIHTTGGSWAWQYGPTIANQVNVVAEMLKFDPFSELQTNVANVRRFPYATAQYRHGPVYDRRPGKCPHRIEIAGLANR